MSKKKKRITKKKKKTNLTKELFGLFFILVGIFSFGSRFFSGGFIPSMLEYGLRFLFGFWYFIGSIALLVIGGYLIFKRRYPDLLHKKLLGFYLLLSGLLLLSHIYLIEPFLINDSSVLGVTWENFISYTRDELPGYQTGGGMIGGVIFAVFYYLFSSFGAKLLAFFIIISSVLILTGLSLKQAVTWLTDLTQVTTKRFKAKKKEKLPKKEVSSVLATEEVPEKEEQVTQELEINDSNEVINHVDAEPEIDIENQEVTNEDYSLPSLNLLSSPKANAQSHDKKHIEKTVKILEKTFESFNVSASVSKVHVGPAVTKYEVNPEAGVKVSRIVNLHDDIALALAAQGIRIEAPIPGKAAVGIEVPNENVSMVSLREVIEPSQQLDKKLLFGLGRDISGNAIVGELNKMPHMLIAGATGSGKSVCINGIITSILMRAKPHEVKMMMIDPKKVELNVYNGIPHLLTPVVTDPKLAAMALKKVVVEMERRYDLFSETGTRNLEGYNAYLRKENENLDEAVQVLPYIVVLVDELADLMMVASSEVEDAITRLAQMARAAGIHLIIATQRPSVDVITGVIKANIPSRIAFSVSSQIDSRTILDMGGAEKLLGRGDMLYIPVGMNKPLRVQGAFLSDEEVENVVNHCINQQEVVYQEEMIPDEPSTLEEEVEDELYFEAVKIVVEAERASISMLQRRLNIGFNRAARLVDFMEERGVVGAAEGPKPRTVLITQEELEATIK